MPPKPKSSPPRLSIPKNASQGMKSQRSGQDFVIPSRTAQENEYAHQDTFAMSPAVDAPHGFNSMGHWALNDAMFLNSDMSSVSECTEASFDTKSLPPTDYDAPDPHLLAFSSASTPYFQGTTGHTLSSDQASLSELSRAPNSPEAPFSNPQAYSAPLSFSFESQSKNSRRGSNCPTEDLEDSFPWSHDTLAPHDLSNTGAPHMSTIYHGLPATPPHSEGNDVSVSSGRSQPTYPSFIPSDDSMFVDAADASLSVQPFTLGEPYYPLTPPLTEQDPNRTIRQSKQQRRPILSAGGTQQSEKRETEVYVPADTLTQKYKESPESRSPRDHPYYSLPTQGDGKYHCPFATGEKPCSHTPTTQKCAYHKYLDSHLKPYRCKVRSCVDAHFSSNACLFRHEREAHGMHGHGENPHLCLFPSCERSIPGNGFPRRWNLHDHMRRVHDYATSEKASSPDASPVVSGQPKKKDTSARKRKGTTTTGRVSATQSQTMKKVRSTQSQANALKAAQAQATNGQQLQKAERNYYNCLSRLREDLNNMNPLDPSLHDKANASLQELHTLGINYRYLRAGQLATDRFNV